MATIEKAILNRTELLVGIKALQHIEQARVILFGVGLVRSGIRHLTIVDSDRVCVTNINRQVMATTATIGQVKVDALRNRLLEINPTAEITSMQEIYSQDTAPSFNLSTYDYVVDAIDSLSCKTDLLVRASQRDCTAMLVSSMGASLKMDPTQIRVSEFWDVNGCPLARAVRRRMKRLKQFPQRKFQCVWSPEVLPNRGAGVSACGSSACMCPKTTCPSSRADLENHEWCSSKAQINGTMAHITAIMGFTLSGLILQHLYQTSDR